jgi:hypothetical protein
VQKGTVQGPAGVVFFFKKMDGANLPTAEVAASDKLG